MSNIYYRGLCGSRLCGAESQSSDWDYFVLADGQLSHEECFNAGNDNFCVEITQFLQGIFADGFSPRRPMLSMYVLEQLFSSPVSDTPFTTWLVQHRQEILDANLAIFGMTALQLAQGAISNPYGTSPKLLTRARKYVLWYINYAKNPGDFIALQQLSDEEKNYLHKAKSGDITFEELLQDLQTLMEESKQYHSFWTSPRDTVKLDQLKDELNTLFSLTL